MHSLRSSRSHTGITGQQQIGQSTTTNPNLLAPGRYTSSVMMPATSANLSDISYIDEDPVQLQLQPQPPQHQYNGHDRSFRSSQDISRPVHETRI